MTGADPGGRQGENFKGEPFGKDHDQTWQSEAYHRNPVLKCFETETGPALHTAEKADIEEEAEWHQILDDYHSNRRANKAPVQTLRPG